MMAPITVTNEDSQTSPPDLLKVIVGEMHAAGMAALADRLFGGKPNPGTKKDRRIKENMAIDPAALARVAAGEAGGGRPFNLLIVVEGLESSDGRMLEMGTTTWRDLPIPYMVQDTGAHGPGQTPAPAWVAGQIEEIWRDEADASRILGRGHLMPGEIGDRAEQLARYGARGVSLDGYGTDPLGPDVQPTHVDQDGEPLQVLVRFTDTVIHRVTQVPTPAFAPCCIWFDDETMPDVAAEAHGRLIDPDRAPEVIDVPADAYELLVAAGGGPLNPPRGWFFTPEPTHRQEMILTADGHLTGHLVGKGECHRAYVDHCEQAPTSKTIPPFKGFHTTEAHCADGTSVACGWIPLNTDHGGSAAVNWSNEETWHHYEHSGTLAAKVRATNGKHGIWLSGAILPGLDDRELSVLQGLSVSGHWYYYDDPDLHRRYSDELLAILGGVSYAGYPETRTRPELLVASGANGPEVVGRFGNIDCGDDCVDCEEDTMTVEDQRRLDRLERFAAAAFTALAAADPDTAAKIAAAINDDTITVDLTATVSADGLSVVFDNGETISYADVPVTPAELAAWSLKYDTAARTEMAADGRAFRDGSYAIGDEADLILAARAAGDDVRRRAHVTVNAERLDKTDLIPGAWKEPALSE